MDDKVRVFEIAEEAGSTSAEVIKKAADLAIVLKSPQSSVSFEEAEEITEYIMTGKSKLLQAKKETPKKKEQKVEKEQKKEVVKEEKTQEKKTKKVVKSQELPKRKELKIVQKKKSEIKEPEDGENNEIKTISLDEEKIEQSITQPAVEETTPIAKEIIEENKTEVEAPKEVAKIASNGDEKVVMKKRGLTIVKKKKPVITHTPTTPQSKKQKMASMSELFGAGPDLKEEYTTRPKKQKAKTAAKAHEHGKKLLVEPDRDEFKEPDESLMGEEVVLLDMGLMETSKFLQETPKPKSIRTTKPSAFSPHIQRLF